MADGIWNRRRYCKRSPDFPLLTSSLAETTRGVFASVPRISLAPNEVQRDPLLRFLFFTEFRVFGASARSTFRTTRFIPWSMAAEQLARRCCSTRPMVRSVMVAGADSFFAISGSGSYGSASSRPGRTRALMVRRCVRHRGRGASLVQVCGATSFPHGAARPIARPCVSRSSAAPEFRLARSRACLGTSQCEPWQH
jgi:hypothetical protein